MGNSLSCAGKTGKRRSGRDQRIQQYVRESEEEEQEEDEEDVESERESNVSGQLEELLQQAQEAGGAPDLLPAAAAAAAAAHPFVTDSQADDERTHGAPGIAVINKTCFRLYPDQRNPLQASASLKYWLGGPDPLDYIAMFYNSGDSGQGIPEHWHYISFGLSDLHGDGRVHKRAAQGGASGFGFELTFRLKRAAGEDIAPMWPTLLLNALAKYVFETGNQLNVGDHVPYGQPLDMDPTCHVEALLIAEEPQLKSCQGKLGTVHFRQVVGVVETELRAAQRWNGLGVLGLLTKVDETGGPLLITDMSRQRDIFEIVPFFVHVAREGLDRDGSGLGGVTANCTWSDPCGEFPNQDTVGSTGLPGAHITLDLEAGELLPLIARGRLRKGKHFTFCNASRHTITFLPGDMEGCEGVFVSRDAPLAYDKGHLQILCPPSTVSKMTKFFKPLNNLHTAADQLPLQFALPSPSVTIVVVYTLR